jgi:uncharacterized protein YjiS (DUF1127 family)
MNWITHEGLRIDGVARQLLTTQPASTARALRDPLTWTHRFATFLRECYERSRQRGHLRMLDDRLLRDVGLSGADVCAEIRKWPWMK